jgi:ribonuclease P protein component
MKKSLTREERLRKRSEISKAFRFSRQVSCNGLKLLFKKNKLNRNRILTAVKKGYKKAVKRNKQKRIIKEIYRNMKNRIKSGFDIIFIIFPDNNIEYSFKDREIQVNELFKKAGLLI